MSRAVDGAVVASHCMVADRPWARLRGLLGLRSLAAGNGLLIDPCSSVHTIGMRFAIDAVFLDRDRIVVRVVEALRPWRTASCRGARSVLELPAGTARATGIVVGDRLVVEAQTAPEPS